MKMISVQRNSKYENRFHPNMGRLRTRVIYIKKCVLGVPIKTLYKYRETYYGEVKACADCVLSA
ncbi:hypothetical protein [Gilvibacter sp.]|jgi:hypothetical protein|uniref:hypothetical protein n=1 Tax=Gilvibacter sp. TaxID=2729997 RepID=UPI0035BE581C